ncbi:hypothetical protein VNO80_25511 [Phaseolus coccineus]|uniref:Uncharacterized protein n=1 Tax=Phaseolus coccineus TaxID=3886 RepID=A0AAN9LUZ9_PHACN
MAVETLQHFSVTGAGLWMLSSTHESPEIVVKCLTRLQKEELLSERSAVRRSAVMRSAVMGSAVRRSAVMSAAGEIANDFLEPWLFLHGISSLYSCPKRTVTN